MPIKLQAVSLACCREVSAVSCCMIQWESLLGRTFQRRHSLQSSLNNDQDLLQTRDIFFWRISSQFGSPFVVSNRRKPELHSNFLCASSHRYTDEPYSIAAPKLVGLSDILNLTSSGSSYWAIHIGSIVMSHCFMRLISCDCGSTKLL